MDKNTKLLFLLILCIIIPICFTDLTGVHYLHTINCSSSSLYIPQGPYLFSHHWPFISISIHYQKQQTKGVCYRDGSLRFILNNRLCAGIYYGGQAELLCLSENNEYCLINMTTSDGSRLTCVGSKIKSMTIVLIVCFLFTLFNYKNQLFN
ncbi:unnamed protein product [Rotaria sp. Silwood1]|nr:unnamed protein product [Rotaria sp. Silwood1]CAF1070926.1 unnamed protein product [Rotaria sp. Silwood1]CAF1077779.1 unnamed protein product [Rotaria sp. Silwood1]CAF3412022.1 unnamed protein product [Rotaria sp. Silwood1]CAF3436571.1 unnamed protein product [Rotaria sp. Silwood1]